MLARVVRAPLCPGQREAAIQRDTQTVLPHLRTPTGFCGALFLSDRSTQQPLSVTLWDAATMDVDPVLFRRQLASFEPLLAAPFTVALYEVAAAALLSLASGSGEADAGWSRGAAPRPSPGRHEVQVVSLGVHALAQRLLVQRRQGAEAAQQPGFLLGEHIDHQGVGRMAVQEHALHAGKERAEVRVGEVR
jgi:hypothetical protein